MTKYNVVKLNATMKPHALCALFPDMPPEEFKEFVADIVTNGLAEPIDVWNGQVIDGKNRYAACVEAGIEPTFNALTFTDDAQIAAYIWRKNGMRRNLTALQRAEIAVQISKIGKMSTLKSAALVGVSTKTVQRARAAAGAGKRSKGGGRPAGATAATGNAPPPCSCSPDWAGPCDDPRPDCRHMPGAAAWVRPSNETAKSDEAAPPVAPLTSVMIDFDQIPGGQLLALAKDLVAYLIENAQPHAQQIAETLYLVGGIAPRDLQAEEARDTQKLIRENQELRKQVKDLEKEKRDVEEALKNAPPTKFGSGAPAGAPETLFDSYLAWKEADQLSFARMIGEHGRDPRKFSDEARAEWIRIKQLSILGIYNPLDAAGREKIFRLIRKSPPNNTPENETAQHADGEVALPTLQTPLAAPAPRQERGDSHGSGGQPPKLPEDYRRLAQPGQLLKNDKRSSPRRSGPANGAYRSGGGFD
jgi:hypothetical protein